DIADLDREQAFKTVMALQPVSYFYRPEAKEGSDRHIGFIAEQVGAIDPSMITFGDDGVTPHAVKYNEMWPLFAASIQKLKAEIDALKAPRRKVRLLRRLTEIDDLRTSK
ncbi:MAG TPA: tail fiber domain-containing protein, partial [Bryobacteraceae bacterium]|nr:tail fiber domain-containing protein [Bryobacteraceae bacterium]